MAAYWTRLFGHLGKQSLFLQIFESSLAISLKSDLMQTSGVNYLFRPQLFLTHQRALFSSQLTSNLYEILGETYSRIGLVKLTVVLDY